MRESGERAWGRGREGGRGKESAKIQKPTHMKIRSEHKKKNMSGR